MFSYPCLLLLVQGIILSCGVEIFRYLKHGMRYFTFLLLQIHIYIYILRRNNPTHKYMDLCTPALVYLVLSVISIVATVKDVSVSSLFVNALFVGLWTFLLNVLCQRGYTALSWILVLLPIVRLVVTVFFIGQLALTAEQSKSASPASGPAH